MILTLKKVELTIYWTLNVVLAVSNLFGFNPNSMLHTLVQLNTDVASMIDAVFWEVTPPSKLLDNGVMIMWVNAIGSWFDPLREFICLLKVISGIIHYNERVSIIEPLENLETTPEDRRRGYGLERRGGYSLQDVGLVLPWRLIIGRLIWVHTGYVVIII